jgi:3-deoxy-D-manno-octulosonate 8-phosphate phosphatase (KDO 8-P phosphatase)
MIKPSRKRLIEKASSVKLLILDVDGVMTDGGIILDGGGGELKKFHVRDGHGIKMLQSAGIKVALITGRESEVVERRAKELGIAEVYQRCHIKSAAYEHLLEKLNVSDAETAYVGDDIVDISLLRRVGLPVAVADACEEAKANALFITKNGGGKGAVREVADFLLKAKGLWDGIIDEHSKI